MLCAYGHTASDTILSTVSHTHLLKKAVPLLSTLRLRTYLPERTIYSAFIW
ncbi:predicted protein [Botrytis cinerea T4]|uniref:Uncharacterized protein n=1 Tax=Botryotinia fuckeliana (strain T4) TaxID=999810 RepID=G2XZE1_BOTF4|nr:predicted protein [Botrytis cinerea T4]